MFGPLNHIKLKRNGFAQNAFSIKQLLYYLLTLSTFLIYSGNPKSVELALHPQAAAAVEC